jgi:hypothetical protein
MPVLSRHPRKAEFDAFVMVGGDPVAESLRPDGMVLADGLPGDYPKSSLMPHKESAERSRTTLFTSLPEFEGEERIWRLSNSTISGGNTLTGNDENARCLSQGDYWYRCMANISGFFCQRLL